MNNMSKIVPLATLAVLAGIWPASPAVAQQQVTRPAVPAPVAQNAAAVGTYTLQPGDQLDISIWGEDNMRRQVLVLPNGTISYALAGHINVAGMTPEQAEAEIKRRLVEGNYYIDPPLTLSVVEARQELYVIGRVRTPGAIVAPRRLDVVQTLALAGGLDDFADKNGIMVIRRDGTRQQTFKVNYADVVTGRDLSTNILLQPGDVIVVPEGGLSKIW